MITKLVSKVAVFNDQHQVLLLRRNKVTLRRPLEWDMPGGLIEGNERFSEACCREVLEETGILLSPGALQVARAESAVLTLATSGELANMTWLYYLARLHLTPKLTLSAEHIEFRWCDLPTAIELSEYDRQQRTLIYIRDNHLLDTLE